MDFVHNECNGWILMPPDAMNADNSRNYHVVEVKIGINDEDGVKIVRNKNNRSLCNLEVKKGSLKHIFRSDNENQMRMELARIQNSGLEVCGNCVARFYKDQDVSRNVVSAADKVK